MDKTVEQLREECDVLASALMLAWDYDAEIPEAVMERARERLAERDARVLEPLLVILQEVAQHLKDLTVCLDDLWLHQDSRMKWVEMQVTRWELAGFKELLDAVERVTCAMEVSNDR